MTTTAGFLRQAQALAAPLPAGGRARGVQEEEALCLSAMSVC